MTSAPEGLEGLFERLIRDVPDFPKPGVVFKDISPLLADHDGLTAVVSALAACGVDEGGAVVDKVVGIEARGFIIAGAVAHQLSVGFVPVRKKGKLPWKTIGQTYDLEYGTAAAVARWTEAGKSVTYFLLTRGEAGIDTMAPGEAGPVREAEERASAAVVGVTEVDFGAHRDGTVEYGLDLLRDIAREIRRRRPDLVVTGDYGDRFVAGCPARNGWFG